jgi:hypothetical protein
LEVYENRVLRRIFGPKREEVAGGWRRLHNEELHNLYAASSITKMMKSRRIRMAGHVARVGDMRNIYKFWSENLKGKDQTEDLDVDGRIILEWYLGK